jgi:hypothetical protein
MKKLKKLQINHEKLMKNNELLALRGGYSTGILHCHGGQGVCTMDTPTCNPIYTKPRCDDLCPGWDYIICTGV